MPALSPSFLRLPRLLFAELRIDPSRLPVPNPTSNSTRHSKSSNFIPLRIGAVIEGGVGGGESLSQTVMFAVMLIAKVFVMCFMGFLMASEYVNIVRTDGRKLLNGDWSSHGGSWWWWRVPVVDSDVCGRLRRISSCVSWGFLWLPSMSIFFDPMTAGFLMGIGAVMEGGGGGGKSLSQTVMFAVMSIVKVFVICFMAFMMASKYVNIL